MWIVTCACCCLNFLFNVLNFINYHCYVACEMVHLVLWSSVIVMQLCQYVLCIYYTILQDLINCTPTSHADYDILQNTLSSAQYFIENFDGTSYKEQVCLSSDTVYRSYCKHQDLVARVLINYFTLCEVNWFHGVKQSAFCCAWQ